MKDTTVLDDLRLEINQARVELLKAIMENDAVRHDVIRNHIAELETMCKLAR